MMDGKVITVWFKSKVNLFSSNQIHEGSKIEIVYVISFPRINWDGVEFLFHKN